jgi:uncharacterized cupredoxin-like copper-binding protein
MGVARLALLPAAAIVVVACGTAAAPTWTPPTVTPAPGGTVQPSASAAPTGPATPTVSPSPAASPSPTAGSGSPGAGTRIAIKLSDALKMEPAAVTVPANVPVTFVVTNTGALDHEFYVGDEQAQAAREQAMTGATTAPPDSQNLIGLKPGQTKELTVTFASPGSSLAGCHIAGHYLAGMKASITIQ